MGYALMLIGISSILLSFFLIYQNKNQYNLRFDFGILMIFAGLWAVFIGIFFSSQGNLLSLQINYIVALAMVYSLAGFSARLDGRLSTFVAIPHVIGALLAATLGVFLLYDNTWIIASVGFVNEMNIAVEISAVGYLLYAFFFSSAYILSVLLLLNAIAKNLKSERNKYIQILTSILLVGFTGLYTNLYLPTTGVFALIWVAPALVILVVLTSGISIVRYRTFDIKLAAVRSAAYVLSLLVLALIYYVIAYVASTMLFQENVDTAFSINPLNIFLALALAFLFQPIKTFFDKVTDDIFFHDRYKTDDFYSRVSEALTSTTELRKLLERSAIEIGTTLKADQAFFYVKYDRSSRKIIAGTHRHSALPQQDIAEVQDYINDNDAKVILRDSLSESNPLRRMLLSHKIAILMPLIRHKEVLGYLCLGEHQASGYTSRDVKVLDTIRDELMIAIQNSLSVQEVRDINASLEQRIEAATAELRTSNARLKRLDASKDEFLSMASHQLRTPLTSVKGYLSMMLDGDVGKISPMQKQVLEEAFSSSERMVHLIHDFLNVSRLQTGKFMLELDDVNLAKLVAEEIKSLEKVASSHNMKLEFINNANDVTLRLDDTKIRQVVMNYIDNAIYYSHPDTSIIVEVSKTTENLELRVKDTGIGVPKSEQEHLFGKFFRATNARKQRPDGTGVGIYLAKKVIAALGGEIIFESKEGKGSTFGFRLPLAQSAKLLDNEAHKLDD